MHKIGDLGSRFRVMGLRGLVFHHNRVSGYMYMILRMYKEKGVMSSSTVEIMRGGPQDQGIQDLAVDTKNPARLNGFHAASIP